MPMYFQSVNGKEVSQISISDRGLAYGDGIFTTAKVVKGQIIFLPQHMSRLINGCHLLKIVGIDFNELKSNLIDIAQLYDLAVLKVIITSGDGGRGYSRQGIIQPNIIIKLSEFPNKYIQWQTTGVSLADSTIKLGVNPMIAGLKHLNRLEQVLIRDELDQTSYDDLLVCNIYDHIVETTCANVFWFKNDELFTAELKDSGVEGIIRAEILRKYPKTKIVKAKQQDIKNACAIFITNSIMDIIPINNYAGIELSIERVQQFKAYLANLQ